MSKNFLACFLFIGFSLSSFSQFMRHEALSAMGTSYVNSTVKLSFSLGQLSNKNYAPSGMHFNEGLLQQISGLPLAIEQSSESEYNPSVSIFPSPASETIYILHSHYSNPEYKLYNINGQLAAQGIASEQIDIRFLVNGIYFVKFFKPSGACFFATKFIKS